MNVFFHPDAADELLSTAEYYESQQTELGTRFVDAVSVAVHCIQQNPRRFAEIEPGVRRCLVPRFPFGLVYRVQESDVQVLAVMHLRRQPGYWKSRK